MKNNANYYEIVFTGFGKNSPLAKDKKFASNSEKKFIGQFLALRLT
jgi:hypothetical protein